MVRAQQLASVAQLVRALHRNQRLDSCQGPITCSCIFRSYSWLGLINVCEFPLDNFHLQDPSTEFNWTKGEKEKGSMSWNGACLSLSWSAHALARHLGVPTSGSPNNFYIEHKAKSRYIQTSLKLYISYIMMYWIYLWRFLRCKNWENCSNQTCLDLYTIY